MKEFIELFNIDKKDILSKTISKKLFYDSPSLKKTEKNIIKDYIEKITLVSLLKPDTINIASFENEEVQYLEIALIDVKLKKTEKEEDISRIINKVIQYPVILLLRYEDRVDISLSEKRLDKVTKENNVIEDILLVKDINVYKNIEDYYISIMYLDNLNLYNYYTDLFTKTYALKLSKYTNNFEDISKLTFKNLKEIYNSLKDIDKDISFLQNKVKLEDNIARRVDYNVKLEKIRSERKNLFDKLGEEL